MYTTKSNSRPVDVSIHYKDGTIKQTVTWPNPTKPLNWVFSMLLISDPDTFIHATYVELTKNDKTKKFII